VIDLGDRTLMPGLIDAHIHLFLHPGAEDLQTVQESVPQRTITATLAARDDLMAGFTAERDMGTEGAGSADTAVRNAIDEDGSRAHDYASAAMRSTFSAGMRTLWATTPSSMCYRTPTMPIAPTNWSP
jgi:imidazolonepropionase-like amidohydrolase